MTADNELGETLKMPPRVYIPYGPACLMAVSPELQNNEGCWYNLEDPQSGDLRERILALQTDCQGELPSMYNKALRDAAEIVGSTPAREVDAKQIAAAAAEIAEVYGLEPSKSGVESIIAHHFRASDATTHPATPSDAAMRAAKDVVNEILNVPRFVRNPESTIIEIENKVAAIITRHLAGTPTASVETITKFRDLPRNWDSYGASPIDHAAIEVALLLAPVLPDWQPVPRSDGGIQFEKDGNEIVIDTFAAATTSPTSETPPNLCLLCGHNGVSPDGTCLAPVPICGDEYHGTRRCGCKCRLAAPVANAGDDEGEKS